MTDPCAQCDHPRGDHRHYPGANLNPGHWGECEADGCLCRLFVRDLCDVHDWRQAPNGEMACRRCYVVTVEAVAKCECGWEFLPGEPEACPACALGIDLGDAA